MKNRILVFFLFFSIFSAFANDSQKSSSNYSKLKGNFKKNICINDEKEMENCNCIHLFGSLLDECMHELEEKEYIHNFKYLKAHQRRKHLGRTINSINDYIKFVNKFIKYDAEWQEIWKQLTPEEQKFFPKTKLEQLALLNEMIAEYNSESEDIEAKSNLKTLAVGSFIGGFLLDGLAPGSSILVRAITGTIIAHQMVDDGEKEKTQYFPRKKKKSCAFILE